MTASWNEVVCYSEMGEHLSYSVTLTYNASPGTSCCDITISWPILEVCITPGITEFSKNLCIACIDLGQGTVEQEDAHHSNHVKKHSHCKKNYYLQCETKTSLVLENEERTLRTLTHVVYMNHPTMLQCGTLLEPV